MNSYLSRQLAINALKRMCAFHTNLCELYQTYGIDLLENTGRRNVMMSHTQEKFFAAEIAQLFPQATADGRTGCADIIIPELSRELECKLTSGSGPYSSFNLQTDWETLSKKGAVDYLYALTSKDFSEFVVLFFSQLTIDDFYPPSNGARGKSRMNKSVAMKKCHVLVGDVLTRNQEEIEKIKRKIDAVNTKRTQRIEQIERQLDHLSDRAIKRREFLTQLLERECVRFDARIAKLSDKQNYWNDTHTRFKFKFEPIIMS